MDSPVELRHLRYFAAVAEELHFGRAAKRLHLAQPALSQQVRRLEEIVGATLFLRTSRSVALTPAGRVFLERTQRTLRNVRLDIEEARSLSRGESGSLRIGFIGSGMLTTLPSVLQQYRNAYPRVELSLHESFTSQVMAGLTTGWLDAGLLRDSDSAPEVHRETLFEERFIAILPADHQLAHRRAIRAGALRHEPFVFYARSAGALAFDKPTSLCAGEGFRPRVVQEAYNWLTILRLIGAGFGVSIAPACVASIAFPQIVCLPLIAAMERSLVELAYRSNEQRPIVHQFATLARAAKAHFERLGNSAGRIQPRV